MSLIKQLFGKPSVKFTPASSEINWTRVNTLVHGPGAGDATPEGDANSAVFACLMAIAFAYPEPHLSVYQETAPGKRETLDEHPLQELLDEPTPGGVLTIDELLFWTAWAKHTHGNAYWMKTRSGSTDRGNVVELWPISPNTIEPVSEGGAWISAYKWLRGPNDLVEVSPKNIIHFRLGLDDRDKRLGLSPLKRLLRQVSTDEEADRFVDALLKNYAVPGLVVIPSAGTFIDEQDADRITAKLQRKFGNDNRGNVAVMSKESTVMQFGFSPSDMDLTTLHRIPEERISAAMGVPAIVAGLGAGLERATYDNARSMGEWFTERKLIPLWRADAAKLNASLKPDFTQERTIKIGFDLTDVRSLQEDENEKYTRLQVAVGKPFMTRNEARAEVGLDPRPEWDAEDQAGAIPLEPDSVFQVGALPDQLDEEVERELRAWKRWARNRVSGRMPARGEFRCEYIPASMAAAISGALETAKTTAEVEAIFDNPWTGYP